MSTSLQKPFHNSFPEGEDLESQIDRLNQALQIVMKEIEISGVSRVHSQVSFITSERLTEDDAKSISNRSEDNSIPEGFEARMEELLITIDRYSMIIEDFCSEDIRRSEHPEFKERHCNHDINRIRREIWLKVKMQKNEMIEKERKNFEEKLVMLDELKEEYKAKRAEIVAGIEKLSLKEELLNQKEKELRMQRMAFDKHKMLWEQENGICEKSHREEDFKEEEKEGIAENSEMNLVFGASNRGKHEETKAVSSENSAKKQKNQPSPEKIEEPSSPDKSEQLKNLKLELKSLEEQLIDSISNKGADNYKTEMMIDNLRNRIATLRGEIAISESARATRLINNVMISIQKEAGRNEKMKRIEMINEINKKNSKIIGKAGESSTGLIIKPKSERKIETPDKNKRFLGSDAPTPAGIPSPRSEKEGISKGYLENKKRALADKEKELLQREALLQQTWMKIPGAKELIENANLTLNKINSEKMILERERDEFERDKMEWSRKKEAKLP